MGSAGFVTVDWDWAQSSEHHTLCEMHELTVPEMLIFMQWKT